MRSMVKFFFSILLSISFLTGASVFALPGNYDETGSAVDKLVGKPYSDIPEKIQVTEQPQYTLSLCNQSRGVELTIQYDDVVDDVIFCRKTSGTEDFRRLTLMFSRNTGGTSGVSVSSDAYSSMETDSVINTGCKNGRKYQYRVLYHVAGKENVYYQTKTRTIYFLSRSHITKLSRKGENKLTIRWEKNAKATGYRIEYATDADMTDSKTKNIQSGDTTRTTLSGLPSGKTVYVRVRAVKKVSGKNYYSAYSTIWHKTVK